MARKAERNRETGLRPGGKSQAKAGIECCLEYIGGQSPGKQAVFQHAGFVINTAMEGQAE